MSISEQSIPGNTARSKIVLAPWVNERCPPWDQLLSAHQVARLTRRRKWLVLSLSLLGQFPKQRRFQGQNVGWLRGDVIEWLSRELTVAPMKEECLNAPRRCVGRHPRQACLPLECRPSCVAVRQGKGARRETSRD